jgi:hypothetical protein
VTAAAVEGDRGRDIRKADTIHEGEADRRIGHEVGETTVALVVTENHRHSEDRHLGRQPHPPGFRQDCHLDYRTGSQGQAAAQAQSAEVQECRKPDNSRQEGVEIDLVVEALEMGFHSVH